MKILCLYHRSTKKYAPIRMLNFSDVGEEFFNLSRLDMIKRYYDLAKDIYIGHSLKNLEINPNSNEFILMYDLSCCQYNAHIEDVIKYLRIGYKFTIR